MAPLNTIAGLSRRTASVLICIAVISTCADIHDALANVTTERAAWIARQLQLCPDWTEVPAHDLRRRAQITETYLGLAQYDTRTIRAGIVWYLNRSPSMSPQRYVADLKVFAFLRVVFQVPRRFDAVREHLRFETAGNPVNANGLDLLWPFSMEGHGRLLLAGVAIGLSGPAYNPLADFDQLALRFQRRFPASRFGERISSSVP